MTSRGQAFLSGALLGLATIAVIGVAVSAWFHTVPGLFMSCLVLVVAVASSICAWEDL